MRKVPFVSLKGKDVVFPLPQLRTFIMKALWIWSIALLILLIASNTKCSPGRRCVLELNLKEKIPECGHGFGCSSEV